MRSKVKEQLKSTIQLINYYDYNLFSLKNIERKADYQRKRREQLEARRLAEEREKEEKFLKYVYPSFPNH